MQAIFEHCSMAGSYRIPCNIRGYAPERNEYLVSYFDLILEEYTEEWVDLSYLSGVSKQALKAFRKEWS